MIGATLPNHQPYTYQRVNNLVRWALRQHVWMILMNDQPVTSIMATKSQVEHVIHLMNVAYERGVVDGESNDEFARICRENM